MYFDFDTIDSNLNLGALAAVPFYLTSGQIDVESPTNDPRVASVFTSGTWHDLVSKRFYTIPAPPLQ